MAEIRDCTKLREPNVKILNVNNIRIGQDNRIVSAVTPEMSLYNSKLVFVRHCFTKIGNVTDQTVMGVEIHIKILLIK
jgi:hypothetical protein